MALLTLSKLRSVLLTLTDRDIFNFSDSHRMGELSVTSTNGLKNGKCICV